MKDNKRTSTREQRLSDQVEDMADLKRAQLSGEIPLISGNKNSKFKISAHDADKYVHVYTEIKNVAGDGKSISTEKNVIQIHANQFDQKVKEGFFYTYDYVEIVHDPREDSEVEYSTLGDFKPGLATLPQAADLSAMNRPAPAGANNAATNKLAEDRKAFAAEKEAHDAAVAAFATQKEAFDKAQIEKDAGKKEEAGANNAATNIADDKKEVR